MPTDRAPDANSPDAAQKAALIALALLLANQKQRYSLPAMILAQKIRPRRMRPIRTTNALASNMAAPHFAIVNAWAAAIPGIIASVPLGRSAIAAAIERAASGIPVHHAKSMVPRAVDTVERFHRAAWVSRVKAATGLDVSPLTTPADVADPMAATTAWSQSLAEDVSSQVKNRLNAALLAPGTAPDDAEAQAADIVAMARDRAAAIGADQTVKLSRGLDRDRREAAGVAKFMWGHTPQKHPRDWHEARNGKIFTEGDIPADDRAGVPPFCKCFEIPVLE